MTRGDLFNSIRQRFKAVRRAPLYRTDGQFRAIVNEIGDEQRVDTLSRDDLVLYAAYLCGVIAHLDRGDQHRECQP